VNERFRILRALAIVLKIIAWVVLASGVIAFFVLLAMGSLIGRGMISGVAGAFLALVYGIIVFISLYALAEIIHVLLSIEDSARTVADKLSEE
jgi:hypothetical protein